MSRFRVPLVLVLAMGLHSSLELACATSAPAPKMLAFFVEAEPETQPWFHRVRDWQARSNADSLAVPGYPLIGPDDPAIEGGEGEASSLRVQMLQFAGEQRRGLARSINRWSQRRARWHYKRDEGETADRDYWPTVRELLDNDGDDCDGLDLLAYQLLLRLGFHEDEVYRAVVRRETDGANHMVTLWFESEADPWVLDSTRAAAPEMKKMSEITGWTPTVMFNRNRLFNIIEPRLESRILHD